MDRAEALKLGKELYLAQCKREGFQKISPVEKAKQNPKSLRYAINAKCFDCTCSQKREVTRCVMTDCSLWNLRPWQNDEINQQILTGVIK